MLPAIPNRRLRSSFALGASICKEWKDKKERNHWCWLDLLFDFLGCAVGVWCAYSDSWVIS